MTQSSNDAKRYRWLRDMQGVKECGLEAFVALELLDFTGDPSRIDAVIDAAMAMTPNVPS